VENRIVELREEQFRQLVQEAAQLTRVTEQLNAEWFKQQVFGGGDDGRSDAAGAAPGGKTTGAPASAEKRTATRVRVRYAVAVRVASKPTAPFRATMFDLSHAGVGLVCPMGVEGQFTLEMPNRFGILYAVTCQTRSCRPLGGPNAGYAVGATFVDAVRGASAA
jgi:hypothetical protein